MLEAVWRGLRLFVEGCCLSRWACRMDGRKSSCAKSLWIKEPLVGVRIIWLETVGETCWHECCDGSACFLKIQWAKHSLLMEIGNFISVQRAAGFVQFLLLGQLLCADSIWYNGKESECKRDGRGSFCRFSESNWFVERNVCQSYRKMNGWVVQPWLREQIVKRFSVAASHEINLLPSYISGGKTRNEGGTVSSYRQVGICCFSNGIGWRHCK